MLRESRKPEKLFIYFVTAEVVGICPNIPYQAGLEALRETLDKRKTHKVPTVKLDKMVEFVL